MSAALSPEEREAAVSRLSAAFADDVLEVSEFERRLTKVYEAQTAHALVALTHDLPVPAADSGPKGSPRSGSKAVSRAESRALDMDRLPVQKIRSVLSRVERDIRGPMPAVLDVRSAFGHVELDLRDAAFPPGVTEIRVRAVCGNVEIDLPEHVEIENDGRAVVGSFAVRHRRGARGERPAPIVRITGRVVLSNVEIEVGDD
jgi:hypothetical protein